MFEENGKTISGQVKWPDIVDCNEPGVYVVAITPVADKMLCYDEAPISIELIERWINYVPNMTLNNLTPTTESLVQRLNGFWIPDETILYIGQTGAYLRERIHQYYNTPLGNPRPHRGGHWIKTLSNLEGLSIYWTTLEGETAYDLESRFLEYFIKNMSLKSRRNLFDPNNSLPLANLEFPKGPRKKHLIKKQVNK